MDEENLFASEFLQCKIGTRAFCNRKFRCLSSEFLWSLSQKKAISIPLLLQLWFSQLGTKWHSFVFPRLDCTAAAQPFSLPLKFISCRALQCCCCVSGARGQQRLIGIAFTFPASSRIRLQPSPAQAGEVVSLALYIHPPLFHPTVFS